MNKVDEQIRLLQSQDPMKRLRGASVLGKMGTKLRISSETLALTDYRNAVRFLAEALRDPESPLIRSETAWALGQIGGVAAMRRLLYRLEEVLVSGAGETLKTGHIKKIQEDAQVRASLIAAVGQGFSEEVLRELDEDDINSLKLQQKSLLKKVKEEPNENLRVAMIETLVTLNIRAAGAGLEPFVNLKDILCDTDSTAILAAIALLKETESDAWEIATQWHNRTGLKEPDRKIEDLLERWRKHLADCYPDRETLLEWLDMAAVIWDLREAALIR